MIWIQSGEHTDKVESQVHNSLLATAMSEKVNHICIRTSSPKCRKSSLFGNFGLLEQRSTTWKHQHKEQPSNIKNQQKTTNKT